MRKRRFLTVVLAVIMAFGLVACGGGNKPAETDAAEPETKETTEEETKVNEPKEEEAEGYEECTIAGYSGIMKQTSFYGYVSSYLRLKITESTNYDVYATTYVDDSVLTDPVELAAATNTMKNDPDTYYQKSLELLEAMVSAAEFRDISEDWLK